MPIRTNTGEQTFTLPCFRTLVKMLGRFDALVEYQELANRILLDAFNKSDESFNVFLTRVAKEQSLVLNDITLQDYKSSLVEGFLVYPDACFDDFLGDYKKEVRLLTGCDYDLNKHEGCPFERIMKALKKERILLMVDDNRVKLYMYYHSLRNDFAHHLEKDNKDKYDDINKDTIKAQYNKLNAPNSKELLNFDDFILCTANIKTIAFEMMSSLLPYVDWEQRAVENKITWFKNYNRYSEKIDDERRKKYVFNSLLTRYGIRLSDYELDNIVDKLAHAN